MKVIIKQFSSLNSLKVMMFILFVGLSASRNIIIPRVQHPVFGTILYKVPEQILYILDFLIHINVYLTCG